MAVIIASRRLSAARLRRDYSEAPVLDLTSRGPEPWVRFSPFYPHGSIPVPFSPGHTSMSVEGIWQGLKVFERADVDLSKMAITTMAGLKRSSRTFGPVRGHRAGLAGERLLSYREARRAIYLPSYRWVLENRLRELLDQMRGLSAAGDVVLLDYETNCDIDDLLRPLSHAGLVKRYLEGAWPNEAVP